MARHHDQPAGFGLNAQQRSSPAALSNPVSASICRYRTARMLIEADRLAVSVRQQMQARAHRFSGGSSACRARNGRNRAFSAKDRMLSTASDAGVRQGCPPAATRQPTGALVPSAAPGDQPLRRDGKPAAFHGLAPPGGVTQNTLHTGGRPFSQVRHWTILRRQSRSDCARCPGGWCSGTTASSTETCDTSAGRAAARYCASPGNCSALSPRRYQP